MTINCAGTLVDLTTPKIMGILNLTPDSFYDGGKYRDKNSMIHQVNRMLFEGATFIDVGAYSSRPGADHISADEELKRIVPIVTMLKDYFPNAILSIDTFRSTVAAECIAAGAAMINDISAGNLDGHMMETIAKHKVPYIMMHMRGTPQTMKELTHYEDLLKEMMYYFSEKVAKATQLGINDLIIDPGFGFAKTIEQNFHLLKYLDYFKALKLPLLVGLSRKSTIYKTLDISPDDALNGTTVLNAIALDRGASILRVHDVNEAVQCAKLISNI
ncbi:dihydropteroate synthase [Gangjinia marincola]|uniref:Dihydropteroate synthase n=1 Tax=Gangjinia marincola TaxID=578463 RepID=A0ABN1MJV1_9FLAO